METKSHSIIMSELLEISENSYFRWKKKDHVKLMKLIEKYFTKNEIEEYLNTGKIEKQEIIKEKSLTTLKEKFQIDNLEDDFYSTNCQFKIKNMDEYQKILLHTILSENKIKDKKHLLELIENYNYLKKQISNTIRILKLNFENYKTPSSSDRKKLYDFVKKYLSESEVLSLN